MSIQMRRSFPLALLLAVTLGISAGHAQLSAGPSSLGAPSAVRPAGYPAGYPAGHPGMAPGMAPPIAPAAAYDPAAGAYYDPQGGLPVVVGPDPLEGGATPPAPLPDAAMEMAGEGYAEGEYYEDGEYGAEYYAGGHQRLGLLQWLLPYDEGGVCAPRWWDFYADAVQLRRENVSRTVNFTSDSILGPIVLSTDNLDFDESYGFRAGAAAQLGPGTNIEFNALGGFNFSDRAQVTSNTNSLFSTFSDYGSNPLFGFQETDAANFHDIAYSSDLNSYEMSFRRRWQGRNCRVQGSWLAGIRYVQMTESFIHRTRVPAVVAPRFMNYTIGVNNSLTGFQVGGDAWVTLLPGLRIGGELKTGLYGNYAHQNTSIFATSIPDGQYEMTRENGAAFVGELSLKLTYRINYRWTFRAGYDFLYLDGVALAPENFNNGPPFVANQRTLFFNNNGDVFYHGATLGLEYVW